MVPPTPARKIRGMKLTLLALLCPPLAVLVARPSRALTNLALTCLLYLPGVFHALIVVRDYHRARHFGAMLSAIRTYDSRRREGGPTLVA